MDTSSQQTREARIERREAELREMDAKIRQMKAQADQMAADAKVSYHETLDDLRRRRRVASEKIAALKEAGSDAADELKEGFELAWAELRGAMDRAAERMGR